MDKYLIKSKVSDLRVGIKNERLFFYSVGTKNGSWGACTLETDAGHIIAEKQYQHPLNVFDNNGLVDWNCKNFSFSAPIMGTSPFKTAKTRLLLYFFNSHNLNERIVTKQKEALKTWLKEQPVLSCINSLMDSLKHYDEYGGMTKADIIKELRAYAASQKKIADAILLLNRSILSEQNATDIPKKLLKITGSKENEQKKQAMQKVYDACKNAVVDIPTTVLSYLANDSTELVGIDIGKTICAFTDTKGQIGYRIDLKKLPSDIKVVEISQS